MIDTAEAPPTAPASAPSAPSARPVQAPGERRRGRGEQLSGFVFLVIFLFWALPRGWQHAFKAKGDTYHINTFSMHKLRAFQHVSIR